MMNNIVLGLYLFNFIFLGCKVGKLENQEISLTGKQNIVKPVFISKHAKLISFILDEETYSFWKEYKFQDKQQSNLHKILIYNEKGKLLASPRYLLIDTEKYKTKNKYFKKYFKEPFREYVDTIDYHFDMDDNGYEYLISCGKRFWILEYCPHDLSPKDKSRIPYYIIEKKRPKNVPKHAVLIESISKDMFNYKWRAIANEDNKLNKNFIEIKTYSLEGKLEKTEMIELNKDVDYINLENYSFLSQDDDHYFINDGIYYRIIE